MPKHNYSQYSNKNNKPNMEVNEQPVIKETYEPAVDVTTTAAYPANPIDIVVESAPAPKTATGVVANCTRLNVRVAPNTDADIVCVLNAASEVTIDKSNSTDDWFKICTVTGVEGYCMRKFVDANL